VTSHYPFLLKAILGKFGLDGRFIVQKKILGGGVKRADIWKHV